MRSVMRSTIMICKTVIWYLSTLWKKTEKGSPTEIFLGPGSPCRNWTCISTCRKIPLYICYVPLGQ